MPRRLLAPLLSVSILLVAAADASAVRTIRTNGDGWVTKIGGLTTLARSAATVPTLEKATAEFGRPTSVAPIGQGIQSCSVRWRPLRVRAIFVNLGGGRSCAPTEGNLQTLTIRSRKFRTARGLRVGDASSTIRDKHPDAEFKKNVWWIADAVSPYGEEATRIPTVEAIVSGGKVTVLRVWIGAGGD
jgi:hypothetical protein